MADIEILKVGANKDKFINNPKLTTISKTNAKWYVEFSYLNSLGEKCLYKKTYGLNKEPFVTKGKPNPKQHKLRLALGNEIVKGLIVDLQEKEFDIDNNKFVEDLKNKTLIFHLDNWFEYQKRDLAQSSYNTYKGYINAIKKYLDVHQKADITLKNFTFKELESLLNYFHDTNSKSSYNTYLERFTTFYDYLINYEKILLPIEDITTTFNRKKVNESKKHDYYSDVHQAIADLTEHRWCLGFMAKCVYYTLHRPDTLCKLQLKDFDLPKAIINIDAEDIKNGNRTPLRISKHLIDDIREYVKENKVQPNDYFLGYNQMTTNKQGNAKYDVQMFGKYQSSPRNFTNWFCKFKRLESTNKELFKEENTLYGMKANGYIYFKEYIDPNTNTKVIVDDLQIIKITGHKNVSTLAKYSRLYHKLISEELFSNF